MYRRVRPNAVDAGAMTAIVAGMKASQESFLPVDVLFNAKLRGQHGAGITDLETDIVNRFANLGNSDGETFQNVVNQAFRLKSA